MADLPLYLNVDGIYAAEDMALPWRDPMRAGVIYTPPLPTGVTDPLKVGPTAPASMGVSVAAGACYVRNLGANDTEAYFRGGLWRVAFTAAQQVAIDPAHATLARYDRVIVEVLDAQFAGASNLGRLTVVKGTPAASPGIPAPAARSYLDLAWVNVAAAATTINAAAVQDRREQMAGRGVGPAALVGRNSVTPVPNNTFVTISYDPGEWFDTGVVFDPAYPTRLWASGPGIYEIFGCISWSPNAAGGRSVSFLQNGASSVFQDDRPPRSDGFCVQALTALWRLNASDFVEMRVAQNSGAALQITNTVGVSPLFGMVRVA